MLRALGLWQLLRRADNISALLSGGRVPNGIRFGWDQGEGGLGVPTETTELLSVGVGSATRFTLKHYE